MDIYIKCEYVTDGGKRQNMRFENFFLIHNWVANDLPYVLYTYEQLNPMHASFGHPSISATRNLLILASRES